MNTKELIGRQIKDILVYLRTENGGLDEALVYLELESGEIVGIPWDFESENIERTPREGANSLFVDLRDVPVFHVNPKGKSIETMLEARKTKNASLFGRLKRGLGLKGKISKEYGGYKTEYQENKLKYLKGQKIVDFLMFDDSESAGFLELENGFVIAEVTMSPNGTGGAGLAYYENLSEFKDRRGVAYKSLQATMR